MEQSEQSVSAERDESGSQSIEDRPVQSDEEEGHNRSTGKRRREDYEENEAVDAQTAQNDDPSTVDDSEERTKRHRRLDLVKEVNSKPDVMNRNRRLLGSLMGHLGRAKTSLEQDSNKLQHHSERQNAIAERQAKETARMRDTALKQKHDQVTTNRIILVEQRTAKWIDRVTSTSHCLQTKAHPPILWQPGKSGKLSDQLLTLRKAQVEKDIEERRQRDLEEIKQIKERPMGGGEIVVKEIAPSPVEQADD